MVLGEGNKIMVFCLILEEFVDFFVYICKMEEMGVYWVGVVKVSGIKLVWIFFYFKVFVCL